MVAMVVLAALQELLGFSCVRPLRTVYTFLEERGRLSLLDDPLLEVRRLLSLSLQASSSCCCYNCSCPSLLVLLVPASALWVMARAPYGLVSYCNVFCADCNA